jgi:hypothetical protein
VVLIEGVTGIGWRADAALRAAGGEARVVSVLSASVFLEAAGELLWVGPPASLHARAVHVREVPSEARTADRVRLSPTAASVPWRPRDALTSAVAAATLVREAPGLAADTAALGPPRGFGSWLAGAPLAFPLEGARARADALAHACADDDPARAAVAAEALLGLGAGLTPSGDDFVGGAFFARALLARVGACDAAGWRDAAARVRAAATRLTHPVSAALLGDLLAGDGWAPMHDLAATLAAADGPGALDAAWRLTRLGHSSGWDLLAGVLAGARG